MHMVAAKFQGRHRIKLKGGFAHKRQKLIKMFKLPALLMALGQM
jgi:hypothetical protein